MLSGLSGSSLTGTWGHCPGQWRFAVLSPRDGCLRGPCLLTKAITTGRVLGGCRQQENGAELGTEISAKGWREPLDPEIMSQRRGKPPAKLRALAWGGGTCIAPAAGLDVHLLIPTAPLWGQHGV